MLLAYRRVPYAKPGMLTLQLYTVVNGGHAILLSSIFLVIWISFSTLLCAFCQQSSLCLFDIHLSVSVMTSS